MDSPTILQVSVLNATSVYLSWSPPLTPQGSVVSYSILIVEDSPGVDNATTVIISASSMGVTSATLDNLLPFTYYNFSVAASTRVGMGPYDVVSAVTPQASESV